MRWFEIRFCGDTAVLRTEHASGLHELVVGLDRRHRVSTDRLPATDQVADELPVAMRGASRTEDTFIIEFCAIGYNERGTQTFAFEDGAAQLQYQETTWGALAGFIADAAT